MAESAACRLCGRSIARRGGAGGRPYCGECEAGADGEIARSPAAECRECGKKFPAKRTSARYCSDPCRTEAKRRHNREYVQKYLSDPEKYAIAMARARARAAAKSAAGRRGARPRASPARSTACRLCGRSFAQYGGSTNRAYCRRCTARADRESVRVLRVDCKTCGKKFSTPNRSVRYCSAACRAEGLRLSRNESSRRRRADPGRRAGAAGHAGSPGRGGGGAA